MITISQTSDIELIKSFVTDKDTWEICGFIGDVESYSPNMDNLWLAIMEHDFTVGIYEVRRFTGITAEIHPYMNPVVRGTYITHATVNAVVKWLQDNTCIEQVLTTTPEECGYVVKFLEKNNFLFCGSISSGVNYRNTVQDLLMFQLNIKKQVI